MVESGDKIQQPPDAVLCVFAPPWYCRTSKHIRKKWYLGKIPISTDSPFLFLLLLHFFPNPVHSFLPFESSCPPTWQLSPLPFRLKRFFFHSLRIILPTSPNPYVLWSRMLSLVQLLTRSRIYHVSQVPPPRARRDRCVRQL